MKIAASNGQKWWPTSTSNEGATMTLNGRAMTQTKVNEDAQMEELNVSNICLILCFA